MIINSISNSYTPPMTNSIEAIAVPLVMTVTLIGLTILVTNQCCGVRWRFPISWKHVAPSRERKLFQAVYSGQEKRVKDDLALAPKPNLEQRNKYGLTPLHVACLEGNQKVAGFLIEKGADINAHLHRTDAINKVIDEDFRNNFICRIICSNKCHFGI